SAALADEDYAAVDTPAHQLVGPKGDAVEEIDEAVAVGTQEGQLARATFKFVRKARALCGCRLGESGGEAHESTGVAAREGGGDVRNIAVGGGDEGSIRGCRQLIDAAEVMLLPCRGSARMDAPDLTRAAEHAAWG